MTLVGAGNNLERLTHVVAGAQFDRRRIESVLDRAAALADVRDHRLQSRIAAMLFYEPSTRTRLSFESAMLRLGGSVIGTESAGEYSSAAKGETLEDSVRVVSEYADVIVLRHPAIGAAARAAAVSRVPVINAGDGAGEHPTQALLDLYCMRREHGRLDGLHIVICGDLLHGRTVHSLVEMLANFEDVNLTLVAPHALRLETQLVDVVVARGVSCAFAESLNEVVELGHADVIYQTRVQKERFASVELYESARGIAIDKATLARLSADATLMHPLPRIDEITTDVDGDPRAAYFRQAAGGVAVRMALLESLLL